MTLPNGGPQPLFVQVDDTRSAGGQECRAVVLDVSERKSAEAALRDGEEQFRAMFQMASIGMAQADVRIGQWLRVNHRMCQITGYSVEELLTLHVSEITHPEDWARDFEAFQRVVRTIATM